MPKSLFAVLAVVLTLLPGCTTSQMESIDHAFSGAKIKRRQEAIAAHPEWPTDVKEAVKTGNVFAGMNAEQVIASWGEPSRRNVTGGMYGHSEQWVYGPGVDATYLYFEEGRLTTWQDSR